MHKAQHKAGPGRGRWWLGRLAIGLGWLEGVSNLGLPAW